VQRVNWSGNGTMVLPFVIIPRLPASVANEGVVYVVAPDRILQLSMQLMAKHCGEIMMQLSASPLVFLKMVNGSMGNDAGSIVAYAASREKQSAAWKLNCGFGMNMYHYMLIEKKDRFSLEPGWSCCIVSTLLNKNCMGL